LTCRPQETDEHPRAKDTKGSRSAKAKAPRSPEDKDPLEVEELVLGLDGEPVGTWHAFPLKLKVVELVSFRF